MHVYHLIYKVVNMSFSAKGSGDPRPIYQFGPLWDDKFYNVLQAFLTRTSRSFLSLRSVMTLT